MNRDWFKYCLMSTVFMSITMIMILVTGFFGIQLILEKFLEPYRFFGLVGMSYIMNAMVKIAIE